MGSDQKRSVDDVIGDSLKNLHSDNDDFLSEEGLARAIKQSQKLAVHSDSIGSTFAELNSGDKLGDFEIDSKITQGGMGVIYSAIQHPLGRMVALKTVIPDQTNTFTLGRFRRERKLLGELHESNVVSIFAAGSENGIEYFAMPFINGRSLKEIVLDEKVAQIPISRRVQILIDLAEGAEAIHQQGIIHRDITPNNVILDYNDRAWLIDFGIATRVDKEGQNNSDLEVYDLSTGGRMGTPRYKAPELESGIAGKQTDVFGLGVCTYCLLTGNDFSIKELRSAQVTKRESLYRGLANPLVAVCEKALQDNPEQRYQTANEFSEDLRRWLHNEPVSSKAYRPHQRFWLWVKRNPIKSVVTAAAFVVLAIVSLATINNAESRARAGAARLESRLSQMEAILLAGDFDRAEELISTQDDMLQVSAEEDPDLFLKLVALLWRTKGIDAARDQIDLARKKSTDEEFLARLDLAEADVLYVVDFDKSESLAQRALQSGYLNEIEANFAKALLSTRAIEEREYLENVVKRDPFHLRSQQLLVMNLIFLGHEFEAREQLASGRALFPNDPSLKVADAILTRVDSRQFANQGSSASATMNKDSESTNVDLSKPDNGSERSGHQVGDANLTADRIIEIFPQPEVLRNAHREVVMKQIDDFLTNLYLIQKPASDTGYVILPPALYRSLSRYKQIPFATNDPRYWATLEPFLKQVSQSNPDMLFLFAYARSIYAQSNATAEQWREAEKLLEEALSADSIFPIRTLVVQELALTRIQIYYYVDRKSDKSKDKMIDALRLLNEQDRMPHFNVDLFNNLVEASFETGELELAADFCQKWRQTLDRSNGTSDQMANALGYSAMVALGRDHYFEAFNWSSKAIELSPDHRYHRAQKSFQKQAALKLPEIARQLSELSEESGKTTDKD